MELDLRQLRIQKALSVRTLAQHLAVHPNSIHRWERGVRAPGAEHQAALAVHLDVDRRAIARTFAPAVAPASHRTDVRGVGLRRLRMIHDVKVTSLASRCGVPPSTVYNWEAGRVRIPARHLPALSSQLLLPPEDLRRFLKSAPPEVRPPDPPLRRFRRRAGLSQKDVARLLRVSRHSVGAWERGATPPLFAVRGLARVFGVSTSQIARVCGIEAHHLLSPASWDAGTLPMVLTTLRAWCGRTQREVAEACGCSVAAVRAWERGRALPSRRYRLRLERVFGLSPDALSMASAQG